MPPTPSLSPPSFGFTPPPPPHTQRDSPTSSTPLWPFVPSPPPPQPPSPSGPAPPSGPAGKFVAMALPAAGLLLPLSLSPTLRGLAVTSLLGTLCNVYTFALLVYTAAEQPGPAAIADPRPVKWEGAPLALPIIAFAFNCHIQYLPIIAELSRPSRYAPLHMGGGGAVPRGRARTTVPWSSSCPPGAHTPPPFVKATPLSKPRRA